MKLQFKSIRTKLSIWFLAVGVIPAVVIAAVLYEKSKERITTATSQELQQLATQLALDIHEAVQARCNELHLVSATEAATGPAYEFPPVADRFMKSGEVYDLISLVDIDGQVVATNRVDAAGKSLESEKIVGTDVERGLIFVKGSVPGSKGGWLFVKDAVKVARHADAPMPAGLKSAANNNVASAEPAPEATAGQEG